MLILMIFHIFLNLDFVHSKKKKHVHQAFALGNHKLSPRPQAELDTVLACAKPIGLCSKLYKCLMLQNVSLQTLMSIFLFLHSYRSAKFQKKLMNRFWEKLNADIHTSVRMEKKVLKNHTHGRWGTPHLLMNLKIKNY